MGKVIASTQADFEKAFADGTLVVVDVPGRFNQSWSRSVSPRIPRHRRYRPRRNTGTTFWSAGITTGKKGSWKDVYAYESEYKLKADAPDDAVDELSKNLIVPLMEKMLAEGTIVEYEVDTQAVHTDAPGLFYILYLGANAEALDKVNAAIRESFKA